MKQLFGTVLKASLSLLTVIAMALSFSIANANAAAKKKVALVIGNSTYQHANTLPNPIHDAQLMSDTFNKAGFAVLSGMDLTKAKMGELFDQFTEQAYDADIAVIYYAGHGIQVDGKNFLIPVDAELTSPAHLKSRAFEVSAMISTLPIDPAVGVVILDACRDNPLARTLISKLPGSRSASVGTGLAAVLTQSEGDGTGGILIAYATEPGSVALDGTGLNSPYTLSLARHLAVPGVEIQSALTRVRGEVARITSGRQRPWHNASLGREIFIGGEVVPETEILLGTISISSAEPETNQLLANLEAKSSTILPIVTPKANLAKDWQIEQRFWDEASKRNTIAHYEAYLNQYPAGQYISMARININLINKIEATKPGNSDPVLLASVDPSVSPDKSKPSLVTKAPDSLKNVPGTRRTERSLGLDRSERKDLQLRLEALGFPLGTADGALGRKSRDAIQAWQESNEIVATSYLTAEQYSFLSAQSDPLMVAFMASRATAAASRAKRRRLANTKRRKSTSPRNGGNIFGITKRKKTRRRKKSNKGAIAGAVVGGAILGVIACKAVRC